MSTVTAEAMKANINRILDPLLFQVVGSTPSSLRDSIKNSTLKGQATPASLLACAAVFACAVNKPTLDNFISKQELADVRPTISSSFSISGKTNMTGLTLLGHCIMTTDFVSGINFCVEFRRKMGQDHLWAGNLSTGSLSEKQKKILEEKKRVTNEKEARLFGSGFFKFTGLDMTPYTVDESTFWGERSTALPRDSRSGPLPRSPPRSSSSSATMEVTLPDGSTASIPRAVGEFYLKLNDNDVSRLSNSIAGRGVSAWITAYSEVLRNDPEGRSLRAGTVTG